MVCHRGSNRFAPENTLASARLSYDQGCAYVEVDVRETADGEIVVLHDPTLDRTTDGTGPVAHRTLAEVKALDAGGWFSRFHAGERVPTLRESIALCQTYGRQLYIENKSVEPARVLAVVNEMNFLDHCFFWSGDPRLQAGMRLASPRARIKSNLGGYASMREMLDHLDPQIVELGVDDYETYAEDCKLAGSVPMMQYFGDNPDVFDRIVALDPPMLNLDRSDLLLAALRRRA
ncbi:glycerophosphodiester phosphodiesterase family protein [Pelagibacterium xiamenense]|uniref:glycerophosphodiester phosphodiesterase family protein n=1 Tax=Pelagibacterium xiamenense TaxID=2901140 RepID=UPI002104E22C|nr:glycerophosphodiester phosphodiesterase family protein [Pelagibacterium xiamenense]